MADQYARIRKEVGKGLKVAKMLKPATLIKVIAGTRTLGAVSAGTNPTETPYSAKGFVSSERHDKIGTTLVEKNDRVVCLAGLYLGGGQVPTTKDKVTIDGTTSRIIDMEVDGAKAIYKLLTRA